MDCDSDQPPVKTACTNCRRAKVKCIFREGEACTRCARISISCSPHVPIRKRKRGPPGSYVSQDEDGALIIMEYDGSDHYLGPMAYDAHTAGGGGAYGVPPPHLVLAAHTAPHLSRQLSQHGGATGEQCGLPPNLHLVATATPLLADLGSPSLRTVHDSPGRKPDGRALHLRHAEAYLLPADSYALPRARASAVVPGKVRPAPVHAGPIVRVDDHLAASRRPSPWYPSGAPAVCLGSVGAGAGFEMGQACGAGTRMMAGVASDLHPAGESSAALAHARDPTIPFGGRAPAGAPACSPSRRWDSPLTPREVAGAPAAPPPVSSSPLCYALCSGGTLRAGAAAVGLLASAATCLPARPDSPHVGEYHGVPEITVARSSSTIDFGGALALASLSEAF